MMCRAEAGAAVVCPSHYMLAGTSFPYRLGLHQRKLANSLIIGIPQASEINACVSDSPKPMILQVAKVGLTLLRSYTCGSVTIGISHSQVKNRELR